VTKEFEFKFGFAAEYIKKVHGIYFKELKERKKLRCSIPKTSITFLTFDKINPKVSTSWKTDELYLKIKGNMKYLYVLMDDKTRFWIAQQVADTKNNSDITTF